MYPRFQVLHFVKREALLETIQRVFTAAYDKSTDPESEPGVAILLGMGDGMAREEAVELLLRSSNVKLTLENLEASKEIVELLNCLPLAIDQAGSYIKAQDRNLHDFPHHYRKRKEKILQETPPNSTWEYFQSHGDLKSDRMSDQRLSVFTTWELSLDCLSGNEVQREAKIHLLTVSGFFSTELSEEIFSRYFLASDDHPDWIVTLLSSNEWDEDDFYDILSEFRNLSLLQSLKRGPQGLEFLLHPLISEWIKLRVSPLLREYYTQEAILILSELVPPVSSGSPVDLELKTRSRINLHIDSCLRNFTDFMPQSQTLGDGRLEEATKRFANHYVQHGKYQDAKSIYDTVLKTKEKKFGVDGVELLWVLRGLSETYYRQFQYDEFRKISDRFYKTSKKQSDPKNRIGLEALNFRGLSYMIQGRMRNAEESFSLALSKARIRLGDTDILTLALIANLAHFFVVEHQLTKAETYAREVINTYETSHSSSVAAWRSKYTLVRVFDTRKQYDQAKDLLHEIETDLSDRLGPMHPDTLLVRTAIVQNLRKLGKYAQALSSCKEILEGRRLILGPENMKTLETEAELGRIHLATGEFNLGEDVLQGTLKICEKLWGRQDWRTIETVIEDLARLYSMKKEHNKAELLWKGIIQMSDSDRVAYARARYNAMGSLAIRCTFTDRKEEAESLADEALELFTKFLKKDIYLGMPEKAFTMFQSCYQMLGREAKVDKVSVQLLIVWQDKASVHQHSSQADGKFVAEALEISLPTAFTTICDSLISFRWNTTDLRYLALGLALLQVKDEENALIAFEQFLDRRAFADGLPAKYFNCNMCASSISGPIFICISCHDWDLCSACIEGYGRSASDVSQQSKLRCMNHRFLTVPGNKWLNFAVGIVDEDGQTLEHWLGQTRDKYRGQSFPLQIENVLAFFEVRAPFEL